MSAENDSEALAAQVVLDELARAASPEDTAVVPPDDEVVEVLGRLYLEAFGLLAYGAEPAAAPAGAREALLARLAGDETQEVEPVAAAAEPPAPARPLGLPTAIRQVAAAPRREPAPPAPPVRAAAAERPRAASVAPPVRRHRGALWVALLFALVAAGASVYAAYLYSELGSERVRQERLAREAAAAETTARAEASGLTARLQELERRHEFVTTPAVTVFALRPPAGARQPLARGALWLAPDGRRWLLEVRGLDRDPPGRDYQLWFIVDELPIAGGVFGAEPGGPATLEGEGRAVGATGVAITLEREGGAPAPSGAPVLLGTQPIRL